MNKSNEESEHKFRKGWEIGPIEAESLLTKRSIDSKEHIAALLGVIEWAKKGGCFDHLDCADDRQEMFYIPIKKAYYFLKGIEYTPEDED